MAWVITNSPTRLINGSTFFTSTRMVVDSTCACAAALGSAPAFGSAPFGSASALISAPASGAGTGAPGAGGGAPRAAGGKTHGGPGGGRGGGGGRPGAGEKLVRGLAGGAWSDRGRSGVTQLHLLLGDMKRQKIEQFLIA